MTNILKLWLPRLLCLILAFAFWYAVKSDLGKNRDFIRAEWQNFIESKAQISRLMDTPAG